MKSFIFYLSVAFYSLAIINCNKYKDFNGNNSISGYAWIIDNFSTATPLPLVSQPLYVNTGNDTSTYIFQTMTDSVGAFTVSSLKKGDKYLIYTRFIKGGTEYFGSAQVESSLSEGTVNAVLNIYPKYVNGLSIAFTDSLGGATPRLPFRLYSSEVVASLDSIRYANLTDVCDINGRYNKYNFASGKYYIVAKDSLGILHRKIFDSLAVAATGIISKTVMLK